MHRDDPESQRLANLARSQLIDDKKEQCGTPALEPDGEAPKGYLAEVGGAIARLVTAMQSDDISTRERVDVEVAALQRMLSDVSGGAARLTQAQKDEVERALRESGGFDPDRLAQGLRTITTWLEHRTPEAGAAVDAVVESLATSLAPGRKAAEAEREERIRADARASIAQRLREAGFKPPGGS